ncbi:MAG TPA: integrase family protein [Gammaproteobacteria bacterium]|nr:integrase family protein [Gammaproteobacteria bacterium]
MKITKLMVDKLPLPTSAVAGKTAQKRYYDDVMKGFGVRVTSGGTKAFFVEKLVQGKLRRITLGRYPELTAEQARREGQKLLGKIATGIDPIAEKKEARVKVITLKQVFEDYLNARKTLKPSTVFDYQRVMREAFADWQSKPLLSISKDMITKRHTQLGERSKARANLAMRYLRAIFNFAAGEYEDAKGQSLITENPIRRLSQTRAWYKVNKRQSFIKAHELFLWYREVVNVQNTVLRDYLLLLLFTGLRREEAMTLKWEQIDLMAQTLTLPDPKNHQPHILPLSDFLLELLIKRKEEALGEYVFPGTGAKGYLVDPRKQVAKVIEASGVSFMLHDLRRTFITIAESLDISAYAVKRLVNHKMNHDVTAGYIVSDVERLRKPMQQITDYIVGQIGQK